MCLVVGVVIIIDGSVLFWFFLGLYTDRMGMRFDLTYAGYDVRYTFFFFFFFRRGVGGGGREGEKKRGEGRGRRRGGQKARYTYMTACPIFSVYN